MGGDDRTETSAGESRRRTAANTGEAGAIHRVVCFAGEPAPTGTAYAREFLRHKDKTPTCMCR
ncbi:hypothetical protein CXG50_26025 [Pseudomonas plecoglossicida]|nr:hypothetical protein CSW00_08755 [Pseudomonas sp. MR 02]PLP85954.1 hypothetical protein CX682_29180 [Pseudomonas sp. FFUP_PS_41]PLU91679.1 hypothetical protein CXG52_25715 [Pseudomonas plecoglossicida]QKK95155.1 hypothetical protein GEV38_03605 [Pseudomonas sp. 13159349]TXI00643.1 MAG: hypothetical protein E6Q70_22210 [Pseudomonas monteilii]